MRYFLRYDNRTETFSRKKYLEKIFNLWFIEKEIIGDFIVLESLPLTTESNICIIYGHNFEVKNLLKNHRKTILEKNIFIISCLTKNPKDFTVPNKRIYISPQKKGNGVKLRKGSEYGFNFDISDVELNLFNCPIQGILEKLTSVFERI